MTTYQAATLEERIAQLDELESAGVLKGWERRTHETTARRKAEGGKSMPALRVPKIESRGVV